jgi:NADH-quinone oxidoreductase subunit N
LSLYESSIKRLLGYSSIVHMGFIIISISLFELISIASSFLYIIFYTILMFNCFIFLQLFIEKKDENDEIIFLDDITSLGVILNKNILLAIIFSFILLSLAGLPFFIGFFSKLYVLLALISSGYFFLVLVLLLMNILITIYYIRLIRFILFVEDKNEKNKHFYKDIKIPILLYYLLIALFVLNVLVFFYHNYILLFIIIKLINIF